MSKKISNVLQSTFIERILKETSRDIHNQLVPEILKGSDLAEQILTNALSRAVSQETNQGQEANETLPTETAIGINEHISQLAKANPEFILSNLQTKVARFLYYKKNGEVREMWCTRNRDIIDALGKSPKAEKTQEEQAIERDKQIQSKSFTVFDLAVSGWRKINLNQLVETEGVPVSFFDINKPLWAEILKTYAPMLEATEDSYDIQTFTFKIEEEIPSVYIVDYTLEGLFNTLLAKYMEGDSPINIAMSQALQENPALACSLLDTKIVRAVFVKRDGSKRVMWCTRHRELLENEEMTIKTLAEKSIEIGQFEVYDLEAEGMRRLNINQLYVQDNENPFMSFDFNDSNWKEIMEGSLDAKDVFESTNNKEIEDYLAGSLVEFNYNSFIFNGGTKLAIPEPLSIEGLKSAEVGTENNQQTVEPTVANNTQGNSKMTIEDLKRVSNVLLDELPKGINKNHMDMEYETAYAYAKKQLTLLTSNKVQIVHIDTETNTIISSFKNIIFLGYCPRGVFGVMKKQNKLLLLSDASNRFELSQSNLDNLCNLVANEYGLENEEDLQELRTYLHKGILLQDKIKSDFKRRASLSQSLVLINRDPSVKAKYERIQKGIDEGKKLPPRHRLRQTERRNIEITSNGYFRINLNDLTVMIGDGKAFAYLVDDEINSRIPVKIATVDSRSSINKEINELVQKTRDFLHQNISPNCADDFLEYTKLYIINGLNLRLQNRYFENIQSYIHSPNR